MTPHGPTQALAAFAASFDPAGLPAEVRRKLGWLLLDYIRVSSLGARLPWSDWARSYVGLVGKPGAAHVLFSPQCLNPQHATFLNVSFGSSYDADDTHVGAMLHPGVAVCRRHSRLPSTSARLAPRCWRPSSPATRPSSASGCRCSLAIFAAASRAPAPATCSAQRPRPAGFCFAVEALATKMPSARSPKRSGLPEARFVAVRISRGD